MGGPRIWLKRDDLTATASSGNKIRKLEYTLQRALDAGADTIISCGGLQSNHCRSTALLCAQLGLRCVLLLRGEKPGYVTANTFLDALSGAEIHYYTDASYSRQLASLLQEHAKRIKAQGYSPWIIPTGASDGYGIWGYIECIEELQAGCAALGIAPAAICHATGSGGTQAGLSLGCYLHGFDVPVLGINVCDNAAYFHAKVRQDIAHFQQLNLGLDVDFNAVAIDVIDGYVGEGYAKANKDVFACIQRVAQTEGVIFDPVYSGKAFYGLLCEIEKGRFTQDQDIIFVHTGGIFGLFAYEQALQDAVF